MIEMKGSALSGDSTSAKIEDWYTRHAHSVYRRALQILGREAEAREVLQDVFVSLLENPSQFEGRSSPLTWLYSATTHRCLNRLRNEKNRARLLDYDADSLPLPNAGCSPESLLELRAKLSTLPEEVALAAVYFHLDRLSYDEIAEQLQCSRRKVANLLAWLNRGRELENER